ncbi:hypothetical protein GCM10009678_85740 [Actinomadura kijaniata]|uniref:Secreted protein n=1 Tax=Actinomadura namibiensis TaxID=182080 RepID=A0A7W3M0C6_ACTNM|nr:hypothetical protein [Actinomadura namibiensis]MBA8957679.1 hypothetical protein [Actinomadura namibiensis]
MKSTRMAALVLGGAAAASLATAAPAAAQTAPNPAQVATAEDGGVQTKGVRKCNGQKTSTGKPYKSGRYIKTTSTITCKRASAGTKIAIQVRLEQYRGVLFWRTKATKEVKKGREAFTVSATAGWKCSGGDPLYRNWTSMRIVSLHSGIDNNHGGKPTERRVTC